MERAGFLIPRSAQQAKNLGSTQADTVVAHINILEFVVLVINTWLLVRNWRSDRTKPNEIIFRLLSDNTSALSWLQKAARTRRPPIRRMARLLQSLLTTSPVPLQLSSDHIPGELNHNADILSRPVSKAPTWPSVIEHSKPRLDSCHRCRIPHKLLGIVSSVLNRNATGAQIAEKTTALWALAPRISDPGSNDWASPKNTF